MSNESLKDEADMERVHTLDFEDQIRLEIQRSLTMRNAERLFFYQQIQNSGIVAAAGFETFKNSWAYGQWIKKYSDTIQKLRKRMSELSFVKWK